MAARYWVGGTGTWDASDTTHWATTSGGAGGASVPTNIDSVLFDASSGTGTITLAYSPNVLSIIMTGYAGTFDGVGSSYTITVSSTGTVFSVPAGTTISGSPNITVSNTSGSAKTLALNGKTYGVLTIGGGTSVSNVNINGSNTFSEIVNTRTVAYSILFAAGVTQTIGTWSVSGSSGKLITVSSQTVGATTTLNITNRTSGIDYLIVRDIVSTNTQPVTFYVGANSQFLSYVVGVAAKAPTANEYIHVLTSGTSWSTPVDWNNSNNEIHLFGGGGGGAAGIFTTPNGGGGGGGGGGGYTKATNVTLSGSISYAIGSAGTAAANANGGTGGTTTFNSAAYSAAGGVGGTRSVSAPTGGSGGVGSTYTGGTGGSGSTSTVSLTGNAGGGGGGSAGPLGNGGNGGNGFASTTAGDVAGGGGGGNGGGSAGGNASAATGGNGGNNASGVGGGAFAFNGGGSNGSNTSVTRPSSGIDISKAGMGSGGGTGAIYSTTQSVGNLFGGGGAGGRLSTANATASGNVGGQGGIVIVYTTGSTPTDYSLSGANGSYAITGQTATFSKTTAYALTASSGSYSITGEDATFSYNPAVLTNLETLIKLRSFTEHRRF